MGFFTTQKLHLTRVSCSPSVSISPHLLARPDLMVNVYIYIYIELLDSGASSRVNEPKKNYLGTNNLHHCKSAKDVIRLAKSFRSNNLC